MRWYLQASACVLILAASAAAQNPTGGIRGTVIDSVTHQPVRKAEVSLGGMGFQEGTASGLDVAQFGGGSVTTDASGTFAMDHLRPGQYQLSIRHPRYPQARFGSALKSVTVKAGEDAAPLTVELIPGAAVSGHILDEDGDPLNGCIVRVLSARHPEETVVRYFGSIGSFQTVSRDGEYRFFDLSAGKYILTAQCQTAVFQPRPLSTGPDPPPSLAYPKQFYPAASSAAMAVPVELAPGTEKSGIDFNMRPAAVTRIHVTLAPGDWRGRKDLAWQLIPVEQAGSFRFDTQIFNGPRRVDTKSGVFDIPQVFPGTYKLLLITTPQNGADDPNGILLGAVQQIDVKDKPVETTVELRHGVDLHGTIEVEGGSSAKKPGLSQIIQIQLAPELSSFGGGYSDCIVKDDGSLTLKSAFPGPARLRLNAPFYFLKSVWLGGTEVKEGRLDLSSGAPGELKIVISSNTATIRGTAPAGLNVMLASSEGAQFEGMRGTQADRNGQFKIDGLAPGKYRIGVADQPEMFLEDTGQEIALLEGQTQTVELKATGSQ